MNRKFTANISITSTLLFILLTFITAQVFLIQSTIAEESPSRGDGGGRGGGGGGKDTSPCCCGCCGPQKPQKNTHCSDVTPQ